MFVYVYKSGDHYEGLETVRCFGSSVETLDGTECLRSKIVQHKITHAKPSTESHGCVNNHIPQTYLNNNTSVYSQSSLAGIAACSKNKPKPSSVGTHCSAKKT